MADNSSNAERQLLSLLSEKQVALRKKSEQLWNREGAVRMSASEWYILSKVQCGSPSVSELARSADITRQAAHKYIRSLMEKELLQIVESGDRRVKRFALTRYGQQCWRSYLQIQVGLERQIAGCLGPENIEKLKTMLDSSWFPV